MSKTINSILDYYETNSKYIQTQNIIKISDSKTMVSLTYNSHK